MSEPVNGTKRAVIIGATRGLGAYLASRLAEYGWDVTATGRRPAQKVELAPGLAYVEADLSDPASLDLLLQQLHEMTPSLIVHNAVTYGDMGKSSPHLSDLEALFRVNTLIPYLVLLRYLSTVPKDRFCSCIVVNSDSIYHANKTSGVYAASKAALRILTAALADECRSGNASVSTMLLGPLADPRKVGDFRRIAEQRAVTEADIVRAFLRRSNPSFVIDELIDFESCFQTVQYIAGLGRVANGLLCKLDGGSSGSLV